MREARAAGALRSRHVTRIVDAQTSYVHDGAPLPFLVMELLEGRTLQELLDQLDAGRLRAGQLAWVAGQLGRALTAAHERGIVHRDLKPSNVFIARDHENDGQPIVKLCDFGIAKLLGDAPALGSEGGLITQTGALLGTPMYLAPELLRGARGASPATDQWSLGLVAFRALAGIEYFGHVRGVPALVLAIATERMPPPSALAPHVGFSPAFDRWFLRSCARRRRPVSRCRGAGCGAGGRSRQPAAGALAPDGEAPRSPVHHAAATDPTVAAKPRAPSVATGGRRSAARLVYIAGATLWALVALALDRHPLERRRRRRRRAKIEQGDTEAQRRSEPKNPEPENPEPSENSAPPLLPVKNPEPTPAPAAKPDAPRRPRRRRAPRARRRRGCSSAARPAADRLTAAAGCARRRPASETALAVTIGAAAVCAAGSARADAYDATLTRAIAAKERAMDVNEPARWEEALRLFQEADAIRATREASYELGYAAERLARTDLAVEAYEAALNLGLTGQPRSKAEAFVGAHAAALARVQIEGLGRRPRPQRRHRSRSPAAAPTAGPVPGRDRHRDHRQPGPPHPPPPQAHRRPTRNPRHLSLPVLVPVAVPVPAAVPPPPPPVILSPPPSPPPASPAPGPHRPLRPRRPRHPSPPPPPIARPPAGGLSAPASCSRPAAA